ncbi:hypothetical protein O181_051357 [Austropuccinia psidii MF-1]|uniref:Retroviral polymerase SH3-like domain-containing protein n=1 Tax=Austropuccinia psidii MF-1 TaxID=1389203 RepID=A0A9Q3E0T3_9BASI|nr:hypothetical protein [Austropuccinia psidii MF-1]
MEALGASQLPVVSFISPPYTPQHNSFSECANQKILDKAKCILNESRLAKQYWAEVINTSTLLTNLIPTPSRQNLSPYALWTGKSPRIKKLRVFGCQAITLIPKNQRDWELAQSGREGVFLGYENDMLAYRVLYPDDGKILISKHVLFDKSKFPCLSSSSSLNSPLVVPFSFDGEGELVDEVQSPSSVTQEVVDEVHLPDAPIEDPSTEEAVDETSPSSVTEEQAPPAPRRLRVIGPRHPTLVSCDVDRSNILPFP